MNFLWAIVVISGCAAIGALLFAMDDSSTPAGHSEFGKTFGAIFLLLFAIGFIWVFGCSRAT